MKIKNKEILAIAVKNNWQTPISTITSKFKDELFELLLVSNRQDMRKIIFNARPDTKQTHYLLQLDTNNNILKILSNPNDHEM
jgi:hypothetical protein